MNFELGDIDPKLDEYPEMTCPKCGRVSPDMDGFGVLCCPKESGGCGYCKHASITDGICGFCGESDPQREGGQ